jgi:hypothetical protein
MCVVRSTALLGSGGRCRAFESSAAKTNTRETTDHIRPPFQGEFVGCLTQGSSPGLFCFAISWRLTHRAHPPVAQRPKPLQYSTTPLLHHSTILFQSY